MDSDTTQLQGMDKHGDISIGIGKMFGLLQMADRVVGSHTGANKNAVFQALPPVPLTLKL
jgi:hypothetical protein